MNDIDLLRLLIACTFGALLGTAYFALLRASVVTMLGRGHGAHPWAWLAVLTAARLGLFAFALQAALGGGVRAPEVLAAVAGFLLTRRVVLRGAQRARPSDRTDERTRDRTGDRSSDRPDR